MSPDKAHRVGDEHMRAEIDAIVAMVNALETSATDEFGRGAVRTMRALAAQNEHLAAENEHLKKAMDLLLEQIFKAQRSAGV